MLNQATPLLLSLCSFLLLLLHPCTAGVRYPGTIFPGIEGNYGNWIDKKGMFLLSNSSQFAFGFSSSDSDGDFRFSLSVVHFPTSTVVWTANPSSPVTDTDKFYFTKSGNAYLDSGNGSVIWSTDTSDQGATAMKLLDSGNLVIVRESNRSLTAVLWQSFEHPTDTILQGQKLTQNMTLMSRPNNTYVSFSLRIKSGDVVLSADFRGQQQQYWSLWSDSGVRTDDVIGDGNVAYATLTNSSWKFYDEKGSLQTQIIIYPSGQLGDDAIWAAVLGGDGTIKFIHLTGTPGSPALTVPRGSCGTPVSCSPYKVCTATGTSSVNCECPSELGNICDSAFVPTSCDRQEAGSYILREVSGVGYVVNDHTPPTFMNSTVAACTDACSSNCSCVAAFFYNGSSTRCYLFGEIGSLRQPANLKSSDMPICYIKVSNVASGRNRASNTVIVITVMSVLTLGVIAAMIYLSVLQSRKRSNPKELYQKECESSSDEGDDDFLDSVSRKPVRYNYLQLQEATGGFAKKLGQGGFGSVYLGKLPDGAQVAVKKLEGVGQGKKEFRAEVSTIGSIHHNHLVRLRGFCVEGSHHLLAYDYMPNGSLDKWIFHCDGAPLDWEKRYAVALGTARALAYLHGDCESKIVHCDVKPENVLLDEGFVAKVSDFGLAKLMTREQSNVFTTLRGTRGYLAPEWILSSAISEKSDVYSYGMVLLEIVAGRKSYDEGLGSEKAHLPAYAYQLMEEGRVGEVLDMRLRKGMEGDKSVELAVKVALWCVQEEVAARPSMARVVQMLEGAMDVPLPPPVGFRAWHSVFKTINGATSSYTWGASEFSSSGRLLSATRLSGPR